MTQFCLDSKRCDECVYYLQAYSSLYWLRTLYAESSKERTAKMKTVKVSPGVCMNSIVKLIDKITVTIGKLSSFLIVPLIAVIMYDVIMRSFFAKPTIWAYDSTYMIFGIYIMLGSSYTHLFNSHVRMDLLTERLSPRKKSILEAICYVFLFFPLFYVLVKYCSDHAIWSFNAGESSSASTWRPPVYPFKLIIAFGFVLFFIQGVAQFIKSLLIAIGGNTTNES